MVDDDSIKRAYDLAFKDILDERIAKIQSVFDEYGQENFFISYSGGKDSSVVDKLIDLAVPNNTIPRAFMRTGLELNEVVKFVEEKAKTDFRVHIILPQVNIRKYLEENGYPFKSKTHSRKVFTYQNSGMTIGVQHYLQTPTNPKYMKFTCPKILRYQFTDECKLKISAWCCYGMKEMPLARWQEKMCYKYTITGMRRAEGGSRENVQCLSWYRGDNLRAFNPLAPIDDDFMDWFVKKYDVKLPRLYGPPFNFKRTGCKGCPFAVDLQYELDVLEEFFPEERAQCEKIWKPVYDEYRRLNYRLRRSDNE